MSQTAEVINDSPKPWEEHHDLSRLHTQQYLNIGTTKFYELVKAGILKTYRLGPDGKGSQRTVRESIERLRGS